MQNSTTSTTKADDLRLAQLACAKLGGILQGTISVGLTLLVSKVRVPDPVAFFEKQFEVMTGFAQVLHIVRGTPAAQEEVPRPRQRSGEVLDALAKLRVDLLECVEASSDLTPSLRRARDSACALCEALREYGKMVNADDSRLLKVKEVVLQIFDAIKT
jgi:hypothetical protein